MFAAPLRMRALPLAIGLIWLACESHFSPRFFAATVEYGLSEIMGGMSIPKTAAVRQPNVRTASIEDGGR